MIYEKSCGAVIWRRNRKGQREYLILKHAASHWSYAKGHVENSETEVETARREIAEETGLEVIFDPEFRATNVYRPHPRVEKTVVYFLAEAARDDVVRLQPEEISDAEWLTYPAARSLLNFPNDRKILDSAAKYLRD